MVEGGVSWGLVITVLGKSRYRFFNSLEISGRSRLVLLELRELERLFFFL